ncbi:SGNH/GDSL hydrolase family protein [Vitiosangium sp. GDMCC 1.1324]|uniref:SGNH/GDSL hydrolase family protein n=1 Tax=Vitiosangium sp. (strain GDMCC 1.1324) TaxID=2138576 RepID=UPI00130ECF3D|nr:SGNH/GDSL hydrolase family protein [Vitiosangium sp. GDMCC 1.1324]
MNSPKKIGEACRSRWGSFVAAVELRLASTKGTTVNTTNRWMALAALAFFACAPNPPRDAAWVAAWATSPQFASTGLPGIPPAEPFQNQTVRQVIRPSFWGKTLRVRISNDHGTRPLVIGGAAISPRTEGAKVDLAKMAPLTVGGVSSFTLPAGTSTLTDAVDIRGWSEGDLAVDLYFPEHTGEPTWHWNGLETSYVSEEGNFAGAAEFPVRSETTSRYFLSGLEMDAPGATAIVAIGDSITEGAGSTVNGRQRWTDVLDARLGDRPFAVLNHGIGGARLLHDQVGPSALQRFDRDVLAPAGVKYVVIAFGLNDIGFWRFVNRPEENVDATQIIEGYRQLIARGREKGLKVIGATLTPIGGSVYELPDNEQKRQQVNAWLRQTAGSAEGFDAVIDFEGALRDPEQPLRLRPEFDSGDHVHPNDAGYRAMAEAVNLGLFSDAGE